MLRQIGLVEIFLQSDGFETVLGQGVCSRLACSTVGFESSWLGLISLMQVLLNALTLH